MFAVNIAHAAGKAASSSGAGFISFVPLILIFGVFYFLLIRPQQKKTKEQQAFLSNLKKGDAVVSQGGLHGVITGLTDTVATLEIADNVRVKVARPYIMGTVSSQKKEAGNTSG
ncbi:MAG: preprotein translocase subunit YajC [Deltaproteobacteria bacterium]|nr:preprotein translocase subunit YajC [Deltaproteobacteria bacterium]